MTDVTSEPGNNKGASTKTILIRFEVAGGGKITGESGRNIKSALSSIFNSSSIKKLTELDIKISQASIDREIKNLQEKLKSLNGRPLTIDAKINPVGWTKGVAVPISGAVSNINTSVTQAPPVALQSASDRTTERMISNTGSAAQRAVASVQELQKQIIEVKQQLANATEPTLVSNLTANMDALSARMVEAQSEVRRLAQLRIDNIKVADQKLSMADQQRLNQLTEKQNSLLGEEKSLIESISNIRNRKSSLEDDGTNLAKYKDKLEEVRASLRAVGKDLDALQAKSAAPAAGLSDLEITHRKILRVTSALNNYKNQIGRADRYMAQYGDLPETELTEQQAKHLSWAKSFNADNATAQMHILSEALNILKEQFAQQEAAGQKANASMAGAAQQTRELTSAKEQEAITRDKATISVNTEADALRRLNEALAEGNTSYAERINGMVGSGSLDGLRTELDKLQTARDTKAETDAEYAGYAKIINALQEYIALKEQSVDVEIRNNQTKQDSVSASSNEASQASAEANAHNQNAEALNNETEATERNTESKRRSASTLTQADILNQAEATQRRYADSLNQSSDAAQGLSARWNDFVAGVNSGSISLEQASGMLQTLTKDTATFDRETKAAATAQTQLSGILVKGRMYYDRYADSIKKTPELSRQWDELFASLERGTIPVQQARQQLNNLIIASKNAGVEVRRLAQRLKDSFMHRIGFTFSATVFSAIIGSIRKVYSNVSDINKAMTQLRIITQQSEAAYKAFGERAASTAKEIGRSITDVISSAETWARLGYSLDESATLAGATGVFANVAAVSESEATSALTSVLKAYDYEAGDAMHIVDILTQVGQKYAISASELGTALEKGGAALATANNSLEESVALMAAGNAAVQNADTVGTALKTTTLRLAGSKAELEEMGEDVDDLASSTSKMRKEVLALSGVDIMKDANTYKSTYQILKEIAAVWDNISNVSQMALLEGLAGKRNASVIASVINNLKDLEGAYDDAMNSAGVAEKAQAEYMDSIAGKQARVTAQFQEFSTAVLDDGAVKGIVDLGYAFIWLMTQIAKTGALLPGIIAGLGAMQAMKKAAAFNTSVTNIADSMVTSFGKLDIVAGNGFLMGNINQLHQYSAALAELSPRMQKRIMDELQLSAAEQKAVMIDMERVSATRAGALAHHTVSVATLQRVAAENGLEAELLEGVLTEEELANATAQLTQARIQEIRITLLAQAREAGLTSERGKQYLAMAAGIAGLGKSAQGAKGKVKAFWAAMNTPTGWITLILTVISLFVSLAQKLDLFTSSTKKHMDAAKAALDEAEEAQRKLEESMSAYDELIKRRRELLALGDAATVHELNELSIVDERIAKLEYENEVLKAQQKLKGKESYDNLLEAYGGTTFYDEGGNANDASVRYKRYHGEMLERAEGLLLDGVFGGAELNDYAALQHEKLSEIEKQITEKQKEISDYAQRYDEAVEFKSFADPSGHIYQGNTGKYADRPILTRDQMAKFGYTIPDDIATTYAHSADYELANGDTVTIRYTPIVSEDEVLTEFDADKYIQDLIAQVGDSGTSTINDLLVADKNSKGIITALSFGSYTDNKEYWEAYEAYLAPIKEAHADAYIELLQLQQKYISQSIPSLYDAIYGEAGLWTGEDEMSDKLSKENEVLVEREELISGLEALGYKYNKNATTEAEQQFNNIVKETKLRRDMYLIASGSAMAYEQTLKDLVEFGELDMSTIGTFLTNVANEDWQNTEEGSNAIAQMAATLNAYGFAIGDITADGALPKMIQLLQAFYTNATRPKTALEQEIDRLKSLTDLKEPIEALTKAQKEMADTGYLSYDTYKKFIDLELDKYIVETADGYKLATGAMDAYIGKSREALKADVASAQAKLESARASLTDARAMDERARAYEGFYAFTDTKGEGPLQTRKYQGLPNLKAAQDELDKAQAALDNFDRYVKMFQRDASGSSSKSTEDAFLKQWEDVNNAMKHEVEMGKRTQASYMEWLRATTTRGAAGSYLNANAELYEKYKDKIWSVQEEIRKYDLEQLDKQKDAFESLIDFRIKMLEEETKKQKEELDKRKDDLEDFYDKQLEMLEDQFDEEDYLEEQAEKRKELADMRRQMEMLERDDSAWAKKRLAELRDEYHEAEEDYRKWERDHARDAVKKTLEDERDAAIKEIEDAQEALDKQSEDAAALRRQAVEDILSGNKSVMDAMEQFSIEQGSWLDDNIVDKWQLAQEGVVKYGRSVAALNALFGVDKDSDAYRFWMEIASGSYQKHASGTSYASGGWAITQDAGPEAIMSRIGGMFTLLNPGDKVFSATATDFLYAFANNPMDILASGMSRILSRNSVFPAFAGTTGNSTTNIDMGDVIIQGNADEKTVSEVRREKRKLVNDLLQEFKKLR